MLSNFQSIYTVCIEKTVNQMTMTQRKKLCKVIEASQR